MTTTTAPATEKRKRPPKTVEETVSGVRRQIRGMEARASGEDPWVVGEMFKMAQEMEAAAVRVVAELRAPGPDGRPKYRWEDIGYNMQPRVSGTTACKRWAKRVAEIHEQQASS
jgi:hypothetical protein